MAIGTITGATSAALQAYRTAQSAGASGAGVGAATSSGGDFGSMVQSALKGVVSDGHAAESQSLQAISGHGNILDVVSAVSKAELSLQTAMAVRDKVVSAYQDIMRMPI